jgi:dTDP-4-amino-4,6-dideoxygalactose transaminase
MLNVQHTMLKGSFGTELVIAKFYKRSGMAGPGAFCFGDEERKEVMDVLSGGYLSRYGSLDNPDFKHKVYSLEQEFSQYTGARHVIASNSGTNSLLISLLALGISAGDEVLVPGYTFVASIGSIIYSRATPVLVEVDESLTMDPEDLEGKITDKTKAIMPVHMLGNPCNMEKIMEVAKKHNLLVIEDGCQAAGATYQGRKLGTIGDIGTFSLNQHKNIAAGSGGLITTNDDALYERAFAIYDQGHKPHRSGKEIGERSLVGLNFQMNELTGAVALAQVRKLESMLQTLRAKKKDLKDRLSGISGVGFRKINDNEGECGTILTVIFDTKEKADTVSSRLESKTIAHSGWHVYSNMEQIMEHKTAVSGWSQPSRYAQKNDLPKTDDLLNRAMNISIGVVDGGLGSAFGINIHSTQQDIEEVAAKFIAACKP